MEELVNMVNELDDEVVDMAKLVEVMQEEWMKVPVGTGGPASWN
jgi:hypothetical protein